MCSAISPTPTPLFTCAITNGPVSLCFLLSRAIVSSDAPTASASSVLLMTSKSAWVTPGPPLRGILSPPQTSMT